ncbi:ABC transporter F family member 4-like protein, partial [Tanacetum coccineum]
MLSCIAHDNSLRMKAKRFVMVNNNPMGKSKANEGGGKSNKDGKKGKPSVSAILASMDQKLNAHKPKPKAAPKVQSAYADIDLPPSDDDDDADYLSSEEGDGGIKRKERASRKNIEISSITDKEIKKREKKDWNAAQAAERAKREALKDDPDAFSVVIGSRVSVLDGQDDADANVKDITVDNFSVSVRGNELLKDASVKISHGRRYGLVGPNGTGKSTLLKLLAWRKIPVPKNIDVLLVEQEVGGDDHTTVLAAVVSANEELAMLKQEVAALLEVPEGDEDGADRGERLAELYDKLQIMGADAAEAQASKILAGLGFTQVKQGHTTESFSGGWRMRIALARALF